MLETCAPFAWRMMIVPGDDSRRCNRYVFVQECVKHAMDFILIVNLQDYLDRRGVDLPGTHWTVLYTQREMKPCTYMDSFGMAPPIEGVGAVSLQHTGHTEYGVDGMWKVCYMFHVVHV